ncbi:MAG TPA: SusC/RagA family TonB-linked outer membrane protein, partial [Anseongella sp.]|nr:SusC/RagA family TonB-linked outer membrane protein [Anseongella sp.]
YRQYALRANVNFDINSRISTGFMVSPNYSERRTYPGGLQNLIKMPPFLSPEEQEDGSYLRPLDYWGSTVSSGVNPLATLHGTHNHTNEFNNVGEVYGRIKLGEYLDFRTSGGFNITYTTADNFQESRATNLNRTSGNVSDRRTYNLINENVLSYSRDFNDVHSFAGILGASYQYNTSRTAILVAEPGSFANETIPTLDNAIISPTGSYTTKSQWGLTSYFSRINYSYDERYLLSASIRTDGSSRFGPETRWGYFPAASIAWRISEEDFFRAGGAVNELKLRASYGVTGNFNIGDFQYLGTIGEALYSPDGQLVQGQAQVSFGNPELKWEKTHSHDIGLEASLFGNRVNLVLDYYNKLTKDLLYNVSIPAISGFTNAIVNVGDVRNKGFELELNTRNLIREFKWQTSFNLSLNRNEVTNLGGGVDQVINTHSRGMGWILRKGDPMFSYYGYRQIGVLQSQEELENSAIIPGQFPGTVKYDDVNGDGTITPEDRIVLGNFMPDLSLGMVNDFYWKNFDLSIAMQASLGGKMYNLENLYYQGPTVSAFLLPVVEGQWWSEEEPGDGQHPATSLAALQYVGNSDYYLEEASFLAVRNINLGYTFPAAVSQKLRLNQLRLYLSVSNAFMLKSRNFNGYNPEGYTSNGISGINSMPGLNDGTEPIPR